MKEGDVILAPLPQVDGQRKNRPAIVLRIMPPFGDFLVCGISSQLHQQTMGFDEIISPPDADFTTSGLRAASLVRLGFLSLFSQNQIPGSIGEISSERLQRLLKRLAEYLVSTQSSP
ncbi:MAG: type II toxin-antitoxin system PemK/MazF family toxin [Verrucomicrobiota bacterium]